MRKILIFVLASLTSGGFARATEPEGQPSELQQLQQRVAELEAALKAKTAPPAPAPTYVATLVHNQPVAYQCFLGDNPGMAPGHWVEVRNFNREYYLYLTVDHAPLVVMKPTGNGWEPLFPGRQDRTVLPPNSKCFFSAPARLNGDGRLRTYELRADAYAQTMGSSPGRVVLEPHPSAHLISLQEFRLSHELTVVALQPYSFN
jgi:hypothetical protein